MSIMRTAIRSFALLAVSMLPFGVTTGQPANNQAYIVEWVYKVKFGYQDEFWQIFQKYQIATLNKEKELGGILKYEVFRPGLHTSEDHRWDYRIVIYYKNVESSSQGSKVEKQLFPDQAKMKREELRRWGLTEDHWNLPIRQIDPSAAE